MAPNPAAGVGALDAGRRPVEAPPTSDAGAAFARQAIADALGLTDRGELDAAARALVAGRIDTELEGKLARLGKLDATDQAMTWRLLYDIAKYQAASSQLERGRYLTTEPVVVPRRMPEDMDTTILFHAATLRGQPCGVVFPIPIEQGSELWLLRRLYEGSRSADADRVIAEFNAQPDSVRTAKALEMAQAQDAITAALREFRDGQLTREELLARTAPWTNRQPPSGTVLDRGNARLRR